MTLIQRFSLLKDRASQLCTAASFGYTLIFSVSDGEARALVYHAHAASFEEAWAKGQQGIVDIIKQHNLAGTYLRVDWVESSLRFTFEELKKLVSSVRRTYFRFGFALDEQHVHLLTEMECNANAIFYGNTINANGCFNENNFCVYAEQRFNCKITLPPSAKAPVWIIQTAGLYLGPNDIDTGEIKYHPIPVSGLLSKNFGLVTRGLYAGHREIKRVTPEILKAIVYQASHWLADQILADGKFIYGYFPCFDRKIASYNSLRHASSLYSLLDIIDFTKDNTLIEPVERSLAFLTKNFIRTYELEGKKIAFLAEEGSKEIKLGANGVALLAFAKYRQHTQSTQYDTLITRLAEGIAFMQDADTGAFVHVLHSDTLTVKEPFRIIYYDGEAVFGLLRLYEQDHNPRWLTLAQKSFAYFLNNKPHWEAHDHWLSYAANEISAVLNDERYIDFGIANCMPHLDFILQRETAYPTLLELMMAAQKIFVRLKDSGSPALGTIDMDKFKNALHYRANYLLNGYFWPEMAMFYKKPKHAAHSFFIRHHAFRTRIDDAQHFLSGLAAYGKMLEEKDPFWVVPKDARSLGTRFARVN